ncbi:MAG: DUF4375 domain-containing protein [Ferruginibacter sp.]
MFSSILKLFGHKGKEEKEKTALSKESLNDQISKSMQAFNNRPIHSVLTMKILNAVSDEDLEQTIIDNLYAKFEADADYEKQYETIQSLSAGRQAVFATWGLEAEVLNGGFNQYFYNFTSSGQYVEEARDGFVLIGSNTLADLTQRAMDMMMDNAEYLGKFRDGTLESFSKSYENNPLNNLDNEFYELVNNEDISQLRINYIKAHKFEFIDK